MKSTALKGSGHERANYYHLKTHIQICNWYHLISFDISLHRTAFKFCSVFTELPGRRSFWTPCSQDSRLKTANFWKCLWCIHSQKHDNKTHIVNKMTYTSQACAQLSWNAGRVQCIRRYFQSYCRIFGQWGVAHCVHARKPRSGHPQWTPHSLHQSDQAPIAPSLQNGWWA